MDRWRIKAMTLDTFLAELDMAWKEVPPYSYSVQTITPGWVGVTSPIISRLTGDSP